MVIIRTGYGKNKPRAHVTCRRNTCQQPAIMKVVVFMTMPISSNSP